MRGNLHVRFGGGLLEKESGNRLPRRQPTQPLKRAAVKFGIGRYLYRLPSQWVDYDPKKRQFARTPTLPPSALPKSKKVTPPVRLKAETAAPAAAKNEARKPTAKNAPAMPANGVELQRRVHDYDARLAQQGVCQPGELVKHIVQAGVKAGYEADLATWSGPAIALAVEEARAFEAQLRQQKSECKEVA